MTRSFPPLVQVVGHELDAIAGSYLKSVQQGAWEACSVCALPVRGHATCPQCLNHLRTGLPLADPVGFMVYAEFESQTYRLMRGYKTRDATDAQTQNVQALVALGLHGHGDCAGRLAGHPVSGWAVVPSTKGRTVFADLVRRSGWLPGPEINVERIGDSPKRHLNPDSWRIASGRQAPEHIVVVDDSWATGASAQSVAVALRQSGIRHVSVLSVARILSPEWNENRPFVRSVLPGLRYRWQICPWTRGECPS